MTNKEWRRCRDPVTMIRGLRDIASDRKSILYLCAGCRSIWDLLFDEGSRSAVEVAERFADGLATQEELALASVIAESPTFGFEFMPRLWTASNLSYVPQSVQNLVRMGVLSERQLQEDQPEVDPEVRGRLIAAADIVYFTCRESPLQDYHICDYISMIDWPGDWLLRCVFGKPFLPAVKIEPAWMNSTVVSLARAIYDDRAFDRMPILGDALEDAACSSEDILKHCRSETPHVRGCWVVDLILGKS